MRLNKWFMYLLVLLMMNLLVGCVNSQNEPSQHQQDNIQLIGNEVTNNQIDYDIKESQWFLSGVKKINTYEAYLEFFADKADVPQYDEAYFQTSGLIIYGTVEGSGSIQVNLTSLEVDNDYNLTIHVSKFIPLIGTCDIKNHGFIVEYQKLADNIRNISLSTIITRQQQNEIILEDEASKNDINEFIDEIRGDLINVSSIIWFKNKNKLEDKVTELGIDQLIGSLYISQYTPIVTISFTSFDEIELEKLSSISLNDNIGIVYVDIIYETMETIHEAIDTI